MTESEAGKFLNEMRLLGLRNTPPSSVPLSDLLAAWYRHLESLFLGEARHALDRYLEQGDDGQFWPSPPALLTHVRQLRATHHHVPAACPACSQGARTLIQRVKLPSGRVRARQARCACDCEAGLVLSRAGHLTWQQARERFPDADDRRLYITGTPWRMNPHDTHPPEADHNGLLTRASPWYAELSPEELYGPEEGQRIREIALAQQPMSPGARKMLAKAGLSAPGIAAAKGAA